MSGSESELEQTLETLVRADLDRRADAVRSATGDVTCAPKQSPLRYAPINSLVMFYLPWPKSAPTAPELLTRRPDAWDTEVARYRAAVDSLISHPKDGPWAVHAAFVALSHLVPVIAGELELRPIG